MKIVEFSLNKRITVSMIIFVVALFGTISYFNLGLDMLPDVETPYISIITDYTGVSSEDIEENIARPLEQVVATVPKVKNIKSVSMEGRSIIMIQFESKVNIDFAAQDIRDHVGLIENLLPEGAGKPLVIKFNLADMPILMYGATSSKRDLKQLRDYVDAEIAARLERLEGVAAAYLFSPEETEIQINLDRGKLESSGLSIIQVEQAIQASNINLPSGFLEMNHKEFLLRSMGQFRSLEEMKEVIVGTGKWGEPIYLKHIAEIREASRQIRSRVRINGKSGIMLLITKSSGSNTVLVSRTVKKELASILATLDQDLHFNLTLDFSRVIELMAESSINNIWTGSLLAVLLILLFLRNIRPTLAISVSILLSVLATFIAMRAVGYSLNLITMGGLALGVGMLVDNAIVVIENIFRHLEDGRCPRDAALIGASEVGTAISASTFTTIAVFFPMIFATGIVGSFARGLAISISFALLSSLLVSLTIIPMMASWLFKAPRKDSPTWIRMGDDKFSRFRYIYKAMLKVALRHRKALLISVLAIFLLSIAILPFLGREFLPESDDALIFLKLEMPTGSSLEETDRVIGYIEKQSLNDKDVISTLINVGLNERNTQNTALGVNPMSSNEATIWSYLTPGSRRELTDTQILEKWRRYFPNLQKGKIRYLDIASLSKLGKTLSSPIELNIYGRNLDKLRNIALRLKGAILNIEGIRDVEISLDDSKPEIRLWIKKQEAARMGLTAWEISRQVQAYTIGTIVSRLILSGEEREIRVRLRETDRNSIEELKKLPIVNSKGLKIYLSEVADLQPAFGAARIHRENQIRVASVTANYVHRDLAGIVREIGEKTAAISASLPDGYWCQMGGLYQDMMESFRALFFALLLSLIMVYAVMAAQFESIRYPFIIMFTIPLAVIGVVLALFITGENISLPAIIGFVMLGGIVVNNGIVLVDYYNQLMNRGFSCIEALLEGSAVRLRPVLITSLTTIIGMAPMAFSNAEGSEIQGPLAISLIGGLFISTLLTLFVVPVIYSYFVRNQFHHE